MAAAATSRGGALLLLLLLLILVSAAAAAAADPADLLERQVAQLRRLETLIDSLSSALSRLQTSCPPSSATAAAPVEPYRSVAVTKHKPAWSDRFQFAAAARLDSPPTTAIPLPYEDLDGLTKYFAVGDLAGRSFVFSSAGDLLLDLPALSNSAVTSLLAYHSPSSRKNESFLLSGHADGSVGAHRLFEHQSNADDWLSLSLAASRILLSCGATAANCDPIVAMEAHSSGRARFVIAADAAGRIRTMTESGTLYGSVSSSGRPLAFLRMFHQQRLLLLTETGAASLDMRTLSLRETECDGLNGSVVSSYTFDTLERSKAYGVTKSGDLVHVLLLGDAGANLKCRVRVIRRAEFEGGGVALQSIRGYLLAVTNEKVMVYNVSSQFYGRVGAPRPLSFATIQEIRSFFLSPDAANALQESSEASPSKPLVTADREKLVVVGLGGGYIGIYRANFPLFKAGSTSVVWSAPAFLLLLLLIGIWQFYVTKKDSLLWTPEEAFNASANSPPESLLGPPPSERTFGDSTRPSDLRELRNSGLRGPTRRYVSPSRYAGGPGLPLRSAASDSSLRGATDLTYRGHDASPFSQRREPLFSNTQPVDDHAD